MAEKKIIFLSHTGGENDSSNEDYADPRVLTLPLECGVTCILLIVREDLIGDRDYTDDLLQMFKEFPSLYGDNSAYQRTGTRR